MFDVHTGSTGKRVKRVLERPRQRRLDLRRGDSRNDEGEQHTESSHRHLDTAGGMFSTRLPRAGNAAIAVRQKKSLIGRNPTAAKYGSSRRPSSGQL